MANVSCLRHPEQKEPVYRHIMMSSCTYIAIYIHTDHSHKYIQRMYTSVYWFAIAYSAETRQNIENKNEIT